jgi:hypothetical protein
MGGAGLAITRQVAPARRVRGGEDVPDLAQQVGVFDPVGGTVNGDGVLGEAPVRAGDVRVRRDVAILSGVRSVKAQPRGTPSTTSKIGCITRERGRQSGSTVVTVQ